MNGSEAGSPGMSGTFATTRWTRVLAARGDSDAARTALSELCSAYYGPVLAYLRSTGVGAEDARDVAHEFFVGLLSRDALSGADPARGRFRSYLLGALKHFLARRRLHAGRLKRGGGAEHRSIEAELAAGQSPPATAPSENWDAVFDHEWAVTLVETALDRVQAEARASGAATEATFEALKPWLSFEADPGSQADAAARLGLSEGATKVAIHRLRKRFRDIVRESVAHTLPDGETVEDELRHLVEALGAPPAV